MDPSRFDSLVRTLTTGGSRRRILGVLSALPLVGTALVAVPEDATAAKSKGKTRGQRKTRGSGHGTDQDTGQEPQRAASEATSCARRCRKKASKQSRRTCRKRCQPPAPACTTSTDCPAGELCESGVCISIPDQCSADTDCDECERCASGVCVAQCAPDEVCRDNQCEPVACTVDGDCGDCSRCQEGRCRWQCTVTEVCLSGAGGRCCQSRSCPAGKDCGTVDDGCGGQARCGANICPPPANPCQDAVCTDNVCTAVNAPNGRACGRPGEVCQGGSCVCPSGVICPASGCCPASTDVCNDDDQCCVTTTCTAQNANCGQIPDGCDGTLDCGECTAPETCGGGGVPNQCGCTPSKTCADYPGQCGALDDGCAGTIPCTCTAPNTCGGGNPGTSGVCGCTKTTCTAAGAQCGQIPDGCGGQLLCGTCSAPANPCLDAVCTGNACTTVAAHEGEACGLPGNICQGGVCRCPSGQTLLPNGTCARTCGNDGCSDCQQFSGCSASTSEGLRVCIVATAPCQDRPRCNPANTRGCPPGQVCLANCSVFGPRCIIAAVCPPS